MNARSQLVSVLLPFYQAQSDLEACLASIAKQSWSDFEVIGIDDGSTDGGAEIFCAWQRGDSRFRLWQNPSNQGIVAALNCGLEQCQGRWIARMDADDVMAPHRLERQVHCMVEHPEIDLCGCLVASFSRETKLKQGQINYQEWSNSLLDHQAICREMLVESPLFHPTFFGKRELFQRLEGYQDCPWAEDHDFLFRAKATGARFGKVPEVLLWKQDQTNRLTRTHSRYRRKAMMAGKAHYFALDLPPKANQGLLVAGTGTAGKLAARALQKEGVKVLGFLDNQPGDQSRSFLGLPCYGFTQKDHPTQAKRVQEHFVLLAIARWEGRQLVQSWLEGLGMVRGRDFERFL